MSRIYVTGGRQRPSRLLSRDEWNAYEKAVLLELDTESGAVRTVLEYASPEGRRPVASPSFVFKAGSWDGDKLLLCTQTEVVVFDPRTETVTQTISHPWFNDLHHVARIGGRLHIVSTGLDCLLVLDEQDRDIAEVHSGTGRSPWERFQQETDYRLVATTKPHGAHPNYVFAQGGRRYITRFEQRDAWSIDAESGSARIASDPIHDGVPHGDSTWFTVVSGEVVEMDLAGGKVLNRYNLDQIGAEGGRPLGWCRGILLEERRTLLAFSRLRPTALKQNLAWLRPALGKQPEPSPTRVCAYDLQGGRKLKTWKLEDKGISSIFSILPADPGP